jgi:hypothetical protein
MTRLVGSGTIGIQLQRRCLGHPPVRSIVVPGATITPAT